MRIALIADTFPPLRTSGAVQLRDLCREFVRQGHAVTVILPAQEQKAPWSVEEMDGATVLRLKAPAIKNVGYFRRTLGEFRMPFAMWRNLRKSPFADASWDGVVWYAPSIFHGPLANALKLKSECRGYLIVRDIFPNWAVDMGLMGKGLPYLFFSAVSRYQYSVADVIGVQTPGNLPYLADWEKGGRRRLEVLPNWLGDASWMRCSLRVADTAVAGRTVFVYAGNMGIAQGMDILLELAERMRGRSDVGFLFVGRGSDAPRLAEVARRRKLDNVVFHDEIHPDEIPDLYAQCHVGMIALDPRHKTHNIPGKFLTYMQSGLPVLGSINAGNDLAGLITGEQVGTVSEDGSVETLMQCAYNVLAMVDGDAGLVDRCKALFSRQFSADTAVKQVVSGLMNVPVVRGSKGEGEWESELSLPRI
jgi:glycosyltransferase involved in cell wall biosynthesis